MKYCHFCKKPMFASNYSIWIKNKNYPAHKECIKIFKLKDKPKLWELKYPDGTTSTTNYDPVEEQISKIKERKKLLTKWHNMVVSGLVNGLTHTIWDGRRQDIKWIKGRGNLFEAFSRCIMALEWGNDYKSDEKDLKEISEEGYKK